MLPSNAQTVRQPDTFADDDNADDGRPGWMQAQDELRAANGVRLRAIVSRMGNDQLFWATFHGVAEGERQRMLCRCVMAAGTAQTSPGDFGHCIVRKVAIGWSTLQNDAAPDERVLPVRIDANWPTDDMSETMEIEFMDRRDEDAIAMLIAMRKAGAMRRYCLAAHERLKRAAGA